MIYLKSNDEIEKMRVAGRITAQILEKLANFLQDGLPTIEVDALAERLCLENNVKPAFKGYHGFAHSVCISLNSEVVHGVPSKKKIIRSGDIVGLDFGVIFDGYFGDSAKTVAVGKISNEAEELIKITKESLYQGIKSSVVGNRVFDISYAIQNYVESRGYSVVREFVGHGIGRSLHEEPQVPNFGPKGKGVPLRAGMVIAIEPMINRGKPGVQVEKDGWTAVTIDGSLSAHFEHTIAITEHEPEILTTV